MTDTMVGMLTPRSRSSGWCVGGREQTGDIHPGEEA